MNLSGAALRRDVYFHKNVISFVYLLRMAVKSIVSVTILIRISKT